MSVLLWVYVGASLGFALCLAFGIGFLALASLAYGLFEGDNERIFQFCRSAAMTAMRSRAGFRNSKTWEGQEL